MTAALSWPDVVLRLGLTLLAGMLIGLDRSEHAHPTGLRTTVLIALAACIAMMQANWLMAHMADTHNTTLRLDVMRIPEGILSGVGFIGAGAILQRGDTVRGITSAATIWLVTIVGLCFGGGQLGLGSGGTVIALVTLWLMKHVELPYIAGRRGKLTVTFVEDGSDEALLFDVLRFHHFELRSRQVERVNGSTSCVTCSGRYRGPYPDWSAALVQALAVRPEIRQVVWSDID